MAMASGVLQRASLALRLVQSQIPLQAHSKPSFPAHHLLSAHEGNIPALAACSTNIAAMASTALAQGREKVQTTQTDRPKGIPVTLFP